MEKVVRLLNEFIESLAGKIRFSDLYVIIVLKKH